MKRKSLLLCLTAVIVVAAMAVGGTLAYFTGSDEADNTFTVGSVAIDLYEHEVEKSTDTYGFSIWAYVMENGSKIEVEKNAYDGVYPGAVLPKDPTIRNSGSNPAYVRMEVTVSNASAWESVIASGADLSAIFGGYDYSKWTRADIDEDTTNDTVTYVYNYNYTLNAGEDTGALFTSITIPKAFDNAEMQAIGGNDGEFTVQMTAKAIQAEGFSSSSDAFAALDGTTTTSPALT